MIEEKKLLKSRVVVTFHLEHSHTYRLFFSIFFSFSCCFYSVGGLLWIAFDRKLSKLSFLEQNIFYC